jgi:hypothetical protein
VQGSYRIGQWTFKRLKTEVASCCTPLDIGRPDPAVGRQLLLFAEGRSTPILLLTLGIFALIVGHLPAVKPHKKEHS